MNQPTHRLAWSEGQHHVIIKTAEGSVTLTLDAFLEMAEDIRATLATSDPPPDDDDELAS
jgi:hypothetical protein